ncbi:MAG: hypothetical protein RSB95_04950 [Bacilli bacterium]
MKTISSLILFQLYHYAKYLLDFILVKNGQILPVEVKSSNNKAKSLRTILNENSKLYGIKLINGNVI